MERVYGPYFTDDFEAELTLIEQASLGPIAQLQ